MMKVFLSVILTTLLLAESLLPMMDFHELSKFPALIKHFKQHQVENPGISFIGFLDLHYQDTQHHQQDPLTHHKLPFSNHQSQNHNCIPVAFFIPPSSTNLSSPVKQTEVVLVTYHQPIASSYSTAIWQPPKKGQLAL
jgi:hypothetical protein